MQRKELKKSNPLTNKTKGGLSWQWRKCVAVRVPPEEGPHMVVSGLERGVNLFKDPWDSVPQQREGSGPLESGRKTIGGTAFGGL